MKKTAAEILLIIIVCALLALISAVLFTPADIALADTTVEVVKAPVSNLEGNATAGKSTIKIYDGSTPFYIPESYFIFIKEKVGPTEYYYVEYANQSFYIHEEDIIATTQISNTETDLYPDVRLTLKSDVVVTLGSTTITNDYTIKLLGYNEDATQIYVIATLNNSPVSGFISIDSFEAFSVPYQKKTQAERDALLAAKEEPLFPIGGNLTPNTSVALRIIIIIGIAVPTVLIVLLLFKPSKNEKRYAKNSVKSSRGRDDLDYDDSRSYRRRDERDYDDRDDRNYDRRDRRDDRDYDRRYDRDYDDRDDRR